MSQIGILAHPDLGIDPRWLAFCAAALDAQAAEFCAAWGVPYLPVLAYDGAGVLAGTVALPPDVRLMTIEADIGTPGALGFHDDIAGLIYARVLNQPLDALSVTLSHETLEELGDPTCDEWAPMPDGRSVAIEACDPCEGDSYSVDAEIAGDTMPVRLSNYVTRAWFRPDGVAPFDRMGTLSAQFTMSPGGYMIVRDANGGESNVFAGKDAHATIGRRMVNPKSRLLWRIKK